MDLNYNRTLKRTLKRQWSLLRKWSGNKGKQFENLGVLKYKNHMVTFDELFKMLCVSNLATVTQKRKQIKKRAKFSS